MGAVQGHGPHPPVADPQKPPKAKGKPKAKPKEEEAKTSRGERKGVVAKARGQEARDLLLDDLDEKIEELWDSIERGLALSGEATVTISCKIKPKAKAVEGMLEVQSRAAVSLSTAPIGRNAELDRGQLTLWAR